MALQAHGAVREATKCGLDGLLSSHHGTVVAWLFGRRLRSLGRRGIHTVAGLGRDGSKERDLLLVFVRHRVGGTLSDVFCRLMIHPKSFLLYNFRDALSGVTGHMLVPDEGSSHHQDRLALQSS